MQEAQETQVWSLEREDPLEKETATRFGILIWKNPMDRRPGGLYSPWGPKESDTTEQLNTHTHILITTELKFLKIAITLFLNWVSLELKH